MSIRTATPADGETLAEIYAPYVRDTFISFETECPTAEEMARRIATTLEAFPWLVYEEDGDILGYAYAGKHRQRAAYQWSCDVTIYLAPSAQRRGIGRRLYKALFDILVRQGFAAAYAGITLPNEASVGIHEAMGFRPVGIYRGVGFKNGRWCDVGWWHLALQEPATPPEDPIPFPDLGSI
ncbi:arsinothricin resistance N-acetyltransferase ArsN1 family B [Roseibium sp.]|uniref:arsinothricin resistance N-acetyltransferase ArsN1 family B n=1 Tax=Roseibium sp. TaxID=1936156 RepID=UPI003B5123A4